MPKRVVDDLLIVNGFKEETEDQVIQRESKSKFNAIWDILENPESSREAKMFAIASVFVIAFSLVLFVVESVNVLSCEDGG